MAQLEQASVQAQDEKLPEHAAVTKLQREHAAEAEGTDRGRTEHFAGRRESEIVHTFPDGAYSMEDAIAECIHGMEEADSRLAGAFVRDTDTDIQSIFLE